MEEDYRDLSEVIDEAKLKKHNVSIKELHDEVVNLTKLLNDMFIMFKTSADKMKLEQKAEESSHEVIMGRLKELSEENKTIAESIVALAEHIKNKQSEMHIPPRQSPLQQTPPLRQAPSYHSPPYIQMPQPPRQPIPPMQSMQGIPAPPRTAYDMPPRASGPDIPPMDLPDLDEPFPFEEKKKKGLFGSFRK